MVYAILTSKTAEYFSVFCGSIRHVLSCKHETHDLLNADKHSHASSVRSDCVHEQVAKPGPVSRAAGMDCECPLYGKKKAEN